MSPQVKNNFTRVFSRRSGLEFSEQVFGQSFVEWAYNTQSGTLIAGSPVIQRLFSSLYGLFENSTLSRKQTPQFIDQYNILMHEFEVPEKGYESFNSFFIRNFKKGVRNFPSEAATLGSPAEGRLSVFKIENSETQLQIKGQKLALHRLLQDKSLAEEFSGGWAFVFRLCPVDYHRFHFPDSGTPGASQKIDGVLHSVNPLAQRKIPDIFLQNKREICVFDSENFGKLCLIEVGAIGVGKIVQSYTGHQKVLRGDEKGYFSFGASTTLLLSKADSKLLPDFDLRQKTQEGIECHVLLGEAIAKVSSAV